MKKPENGVYVAKVTDDTVKTFHADENAMADAQTEKMFSNRDKAWEDQKRDAAAKLRTEEMQQRKSSQEDAKRSRRRWYTVKDCMSLIVTALLVYCTYRFGQLVAIGAIVGCLVAAVCRVSNHIESERRERCNA